MLTLIKNYIIKVKEKPEPKRKTLLFLWSSGLTLLIALVWFVNFNYVLYNKNLEEAELLAKAEESLKTGQTEVVENKQASSHDALWLNFFKNNVAAVAEGFKVLTGQMSE